MPNLLQKASIVLTPTAYDDGKVLCAKPSEPPYGDFDFSRNSAATRVNAQGLVENVQTLSGNLVQNGDFSELGAEEVSNGSFSQQGSELVTNGSFDTDSDWSLGTGWSISGGKANYDGLQASQLLRQGTANGVVGKTFLVKYDVVNNSGVGGIQAKFGGVNLSNYNSDNGSFEFYVVAVSTDYIRFIPQLDFTGSIDNVSVVEVGQDWVFTSGATLTALGAKITHAPDPGSISQSGLLIVGKNYKLTYEITESVSGGLKLNSAVDPSMVASVGVHVKYFEADATSFGIARTNSTNNDVTITNISVKEVGQNWTLGAGWEISDSKAVFSDTANGDIRTSSSIFTANSKYKISLIVSDLTSGTAFFGIGDGAASNLVNYDNYTNGDYSFEVTAPSGQELRIYATTSSGSSFSITNISVIEITDDTNLPRINYEGFSYQDALGSEQIVNGTFDSGSDWSMQASWSIANGKASYNGAGNGHYIKQNASLIIGKEYIAKLDILDNSGNFRVSVDGGTASYNNYTTGNGTYSFTFIASSSEFFVRASMGFSSDTLSIDNVSVKEYLGQEVVPDSGCGHWLWEPQSTNFVTQSELFSGWSQTAISVFSNNIASPSGEINATRIVESSTNSVHSLSLGGVTTGNQYTISVFAKAEERSIISFGGLGLYSNNEFVQYDLINGTATNTGTTNNASVSIENYGNGWYRCIATYTATGSSGLVIAMLDQLYTGNSGSGSGQTYQGDGVSGLYIWGAQLEQQSYATSYIPSNGTSVTRNQDVCNNGGSLASINSTEGVLYAEIAALANDGTFKAISLSDGSTSNVVRFYKNTTDNQLSIRVTSSGVNYFNQIFTLTNSNATNKLALKYKENDFAFWVNGVEVKADNNGITPIGLNVLNFGEGNGLSPFYGKTKCVAVWKEALSDEELTLLTAPAPVAPTFTLDFDEIANQFTFSRASFGTIVNEQGLIETVSNIGPEEIVNGDFATDTAWDKLNATISGGLGNLNGTGVTSMLYQDVLTNGSTYTVNYTILNYNGIGIADIINVAGAPLALINSNGTFTFTFTHTNANGNIYFRARNSAIFSIDNVSVKEYTEDDIPRIDYSTGTEAFLLEPQSTNLITYSSGLLNWINSGGNTLTSGLTSPSGESDAFSILSGTGTSSRLVYTTNLSATETQHTLSAFVKQVNGFNTAYLRWGSSELANNIVSFAFDTETLTNLGGNTTDLFVKNFANGWYRIGFTFTTGTAITNQGVQINRGSSVEAAYWGIQLEQQSYATSYIPTSGTTVTRVGETCVNATPEINSEEGVLYAEIEANSNDLTNRVISLSDGSTANRVSIVLGAGSNEIRGQVLSSGTSFDFSTTSYNTLNKNKIAISYKLNDFKMYINGVEVATDTSGNTPIGMNRLGFNAGDNILHFYGNTKDLQVFTEALSDYQLAQLTTI